MASTLLDKESLSGLVLSPRSMGFDLVVSIGVLSCLLCLYGSGGDILVISSVSISCCFFLILALFESRWFGFLFLAIILI